MKKSCIKEVILKVKEELTKSKNELTLQELKNIVPNINRTIIRYMTREDILKKTINYAHNSEKTFINPKTSKQEKINGTMFYTYSLNN